MFQEDLIESLVGMTDPAERHLRSGELAELVGGKELLIFCRDPEIGVLLPGPGFPQTVRGGLDWQEFLGRCIEAGEHEAVLPHPLHATRQRWFGFSVGSNAEALVAIQASERLPREKIESLLKVLPILIAAFRSESNAVAARVKASSCTAAADRAQNLAVQLDKLRRRLQRTLIKVRSSREQTSFLSEASRRLSASLDRETMLQQCREILIPAFSDAAYVYLREGDELMRCRSFMDVLDRNEALQKLLQDQIENVQRTREPDERRAHEFQAIAFPLSWRFQLNGILVVVRKFPCSAPYREDEVRVLKDFCLRLSVSLENSYLYRDARLAVRAREEFLSIASHELKTPLTTILLGHQLIKRRFRSEAQCPALKASISPLVDSVEEQLKNLGSLVDRLLDVTRACEPKISLEKSEFDLGELVHKLVERFHEHVNLVGSRIVAHVTEVWVRCDQLRIEQAINNLITNAIKYGAGSEIEVRVQESSGFASVVVRDQGIGICPADQERIFDRFERAVDYRKISGLGLGLYIAKQIIESHGGLIQVQSEAGKGSTFEIRVPQRA